MTSATPKRVIGWCLLIGTLCFTAYFQLFSRTIITTPEGPNAQEIIAAAEAIRNAAIAQPHQFGIDKTDVHTLRVTDSVPSSKAGVRHVYLAQEVGGVPISNTLLSTIVKLAPHGGRSNYNYLRGTADEYRMPSQSKTNSKVNDIVKIVSSKNGQALVKNADHCVNTKEPALSAGEALSLAAIEVLGVHNPNLRRRVLKADSFTNNNVKDVRKKTVFEPHDRISINDTPCQLAFWNNDKTDGGDCIVRLAWECIVKPKRTNYMHIFVDAVEGTVINIRKFGPADQNDDEKNGDFDINTMQQQTDPSRRRLSAFSAVPYPNENPCPSCPKFKLNMTESDKTFDIADIEPLALVQNPEFIDSSPNGWLKIGDTTYVETRGNNARVAFSVIQDSVDPYSSGVTISATDPSSNVFDYSDQSVIQEDNNVVTRLDDPVSASLEAAVVNAFYWTNIVHDIFYQYGFNEESGNFQEENYNRGGKEGDSVIVEVRETSVFNNAFFVNAKDGENPLLLLYLFIRSDETVLEVDGQEYNATAFAFGPTEFNLADTPIVYSKGRVCQNLKDYAYAGSIVVIDSGDCSFSSMVKNAQNRGAKAVILVVDPWDRPGSFSMSDVDASINIPSVSITKHDAERLLASLTPTSKSVLGPGLIVRDGAFDNSIIIHEYCHGITTRLTGGPSTTMCLNPDTNRELGKEGWEDICSLFITATNITGRTRTIGSFASWNVEGIRPFPYSTDMNINPNTYAYLNTNPGSHLIGSMFGTVLWDMYWAIIDHEEENGRIGFNENKYDSQTGGSNIAMQLIVESLKIQPCSPSFLDSRDAILMADTLIYDEQYKCVIWIAFAKRGLGESAIASPFGTTPLNVTEAFDVPAYCMGPTLSLTSHNYTIVTGDGDFFVDNCELLTLTINFQNTGVGNLTDLQLVGVSSNLGTTVIMNQLPMQLLDLPERAQMSIVVDLKVDGLVFGRPLELEAKFTALEVVEPLSIFMTITETSGDIAAKEKVTWEIGEGDNEWTGIDGYFSLEPSRSSLRVDDVVYYSPVAMFGPQKFSLVDAFIQEGQGVGCEGVDDGKYAGFVVLFERGECDFTVQVQNAQNGGALGVIVMNYEDQYPFSMDGQNVDIKIPAVMVDNTSGQRIKQNIDKALATLSFDYERKETLSSFLSLPEQCNRVRSPSFLLYNHSAISIWVNFGINGIADDDSVYDRANVGLFCKGERVTITPDDGHQYNSYGTINTKTIETCPAPGTIGWREGTGSGFKKVVFSSDALRDANKMIGEIVQLDIALATGASAYGSYFSIQRVELTNVGIPVPDKGSTCSISNPNEENALNVPELNSTFTTSTFPDSENDLMEGNTDEDEGRYGGLNGGFISFVAIPLVAIPAAFSAYCLTQRRRRKEKEELEHVRNFCKLANNSDLENPMQVLDEVEVSLNSAVVPALSTEEKDLNESQIKGTQSNATSDRTFSALTESLSSSFASSSALEEEEHDESQEPQSDDDLIDDEGALRIMSFISIFL